ncbi:MAG: ATP-binding protein [Oscillospiraceae bacterium]|nr:ATP-binding protein [Oscillospiraceae bacterium]
MDDALIPEDINGKLLEENRKLLEEVEELRREAKKCAREMRLQSSFLSKITKASEAKDAFNSSLLKANEKQRVYMDMLLQNCPNIIILLNDEGRFVLSTEAFMSAMNTPNFDYIKNLRYSEVFQKCFTDDRMAYFDTAFDRVVKSNEVVRFDAQADFNRSGTPRFYSIELRRAGIELHNHNKDEDDSVSGVLVVMIDLTEVMLEKQNAEAANNAKSTFLATMSHEIRTPIGAILGIVQIEMLKENLPEEYISALEKIYRSGNGLIGIINDILDMSKIETGKLELVPIEYDVPSLINDVVQLNIARISSKPIKFILDADAKLPSTLYGDELRLKQILNNLLSNAIKYTAAGHVKLSVRHFVQDGDIMLSFTVEDTGQGIKPEDQKKLFTEYTRFNHTANRATEGTGLGLSITKNLVAMMGGLIEAKSEYGKGSAFTVTIKQQAVECEPIGEELAKKLGNFTFTGSGQAAGVKIVREFMPYGKVLVVDDVEANLYVAEGLMSPYKIKIETVTDGFAAIERAEQGEVYDIIFMDHMMPRMDGIETTQKLRDMGYNGTIVALTANALAGNDEMFMRNGFDGFISKPIDIRQLNDALNKFIRDMHPEEAEKYKATAAEATPVQTPKASPKLLEIFRRDAEKAVAALRKTVMEDKFRRVNDVSSFTTTFHAMKSALAVIGEDEISKLAFELEKAGNNKDRSFIFSNVENFTNTLENLIIKLTPEISAVSDDESIQEDTAYLSEQLKIIQAACDEYDDEAAYAALDRLQEKKWSTETAAALENIRDMLFLHSDFEEAAKAAKQFAVNNEQ